MIDPAARLARVGGAIFGASTLAAAALAVGLIAVFRRHAPLMTLIVVNLQVFVPAVAAVAALVSGAPAAAIPLALIAALAAWGVRLWRNEIGLCARLLGLSAAAVADVPGLVGAAAVTALGGAAGAGLLGACAVAALATGRVVPNPAVVSTAAKATCVDASGAAVACCAWVPSLWALPVVLSSILAAAWVGATAGQARTFVIADAAAQWWFAPRVEAEVAAAAPVSPASLPAPLLVGATRRAASHAAGPSAGSLAMGGAVMTAASAVRALLQSATTAADEDGGGPGFFASLVGAVGGAALEALSVLTRYATICAAVTGGGLLESGRSATRLLSSLALSTLGVWWVPPLVLNLYTALLAGVWGLSAGALYALTAPKAAHGRTGDDYAQAVLTHAAGVGVAAAAVVGALTSFAAGVLLSTTEALYFTWALDRASSATPARVDAADVFLAVPCGVVVEQPDGGLAYGAGGGGTGGRRRYVPPSQLPAGGLAGRPVGDGAA